MSALDPLIAAELAMADAEEAAPTVDLRTLLGEMAALRVEVRKQTEASRALRTEVEGQQTTVNAAPGTPNASTSPTPDGLPLLFDVLDRIDAAIQSLQVPARRSWFMRADPRVAALLEGLRMTRAHAQSGLSTLGVQRIDTGGAFDPTRMQAIEAVPGGTQGDVHTEILPGYQHGETVLRLAQVTVHGGAS